MDSIVVPQMLSQGLEKGEGREHRVTEKQKLGYSTDRK